MAFENDSKTTPLENVLLRYKESGGTRERAIASLNSLGFAKNFIYQDQEDAINAVFAETRTMGEQGYDEAIDNNDKRNKARLKYQKEVLAKEAKNPKKTEDKPKLQRPIHLDVNEDKTMAEQGYDKAMRDNEKRHKARLEYQQKVLAQEAQEAEINKAQVAQQPEVVATKRSKQEQVKPLEAPKRKSGAFLVGSNSNLILPDIGAVPPTPEEEQDYSFFGDMIPASFGTDHSIGSMLAEESGLPTRYDLLDDTNYDFQEKIKGTKYESIPEAFIYAKNDAHVTAIKMQIDSEEHKRKVIADSGFLGFVASFAVGVFEPLNLIPVGGTAVRTYKVGGSMLKGGYHTALAGFIGMSASESALHQSQLTRTYGESALNITAGTFLSGLIGSSISGYRTWAINLHGEDAIKNLEKRIEKDMEITAPDEVDPTVPHSVPRTVGAMQTNAPKAGHDEIVDDFGIIRKLKNLAPNTRVFFSPLTTARNIAQMLVANPFIIGKNKEGLDSHQSAEIASIFYQRGLYTATKNLDDQFIQYRLGRGGRIGDVAGIGLADKFNKNNKKLTREEFNEEVGKAMRNGDTHEIPEVAQSAQMYRKEVFDPLAKKAIELELLPKEILEQGPETAKSYLNRVYNREKLIADPDGFEKATFDWLRTQDTEKLGLQADVAIKGNSLKVTNEESQKLSASISNTDKQIAQTEKQLKELQRNEKKAIDRAFSSKEKSNEVEELSTELDALKDKLASLKFDKSKLSASETKSLAQGEADLKVLLKEKALIRKEKVVDEEKLKEVNERIATKRGEVNGYKAKGKLKVKRGALTGINKEIAEKTAKLKSAKANLSQREKGNKGQRRELGVFEGSFRNRSNILQDRLSGLKHKKADKEASLDKNRAEAESLMSELEALISRYPSNVTKDFESFLKARKKATDKATDAGKEIDTFNITNKALKKAVNRILKNETGRNDYALQQLAKEIRERIISTPLGRLPYDQANPSSNAFVDDAVSQFGVEKSQSLNARSFLIPDKSIEGYLENNIDVLANVYSKSMSIDVAITERFGSLDLKESAKEMQEELRDLLEQAKTPQERQALQKEFEKNVQDLVGMLQRLRGIYDRPRDPEALLARAGVVARSWNYIRLLGGMTASALPDPFRIAMMHGMGRLVGDALLPMITNLKKFRMAGEEVKRLGNALDYVLDTRSRILADVADDHGRGTKFERGLHGLTQNFGIVSLMAPWNAMWKQASGMATINRIMDGLMSAKNGTIKAIDSEFLSFVGIGNSDAILEQFKKYGNKDGRHFMLNTDAWDNKEAVEEMANAMNLVINQTIVTPGQEVPLIFSTQGGKTIFQFKTFVASSTQKVALSGIQRKDMNTLSGMIGMVGMGMMAYAFKEWDRGAELSDDPMVWIKEGVDRSGVFGWFTEGNLMLEKLSENELGLGPSLGIEKPASRYASRSALDTILGPTLGSTSDLVLNTVGSVLKGEADQQDIKALRKLLPYQNLSGFRNVVDEVEDAVIDKFNIPKSTK